MKDYYGTCWNCGRNYTKSRIDQIFRCAKCGRKYRYAKVPTCKVCLVNCDKRDETRKYAPKECVLRG